MLYQNPDEFLYAIHDVARAMSIRVLLKKACHQTLERDEQLLLLSLLERAIVFTDRVPDNTRALYMRFASATGIVEVKEFNANSVVYGYSFHVDLSVRDFNLELAAIDGIVDSIMLLKAEHLADQTRRIKDLACSKS